MKNKKNKIAFFSPFEPIKSGISVYSKELLLHLAKVFDITVVTNGYLPDSAAVPKGLEVIDCKKIDDVDSFMGQFDEILYHMGNHEYHGYIYNMLLEVPGVVVMHDYSIHNMIAAITLSKENGVQLYEKELNDCGVYLEGVPEVPLGENHDPVMSMWVMPLQYPLNEKVLANSRSIIMHSKFAKNLAIENLPLLKIESIPLFVSLFKEFNEKESDEIVIGSFGLVSKHKRPEVLLEVVADLIKESEKKIKLWIVGGFGSKAYQDKLESLVGKLGISSDVEITGFISEKEYFKKLDDTDICVNLRYPTFGETSISLMQILGFSKPCITTDIGWFSELPDDCVVKVPTPDNGEKKYLKEALENLVENFDARKTMGENSYNYVKSECSIEKVANQYEEVILNSIYQRELGAKLTSKIVCVMEECGIEAADTNIISNLSNSVKDIL